MTYKFDEDGLLIVPRKTDKEESNKKVCEFCGKPAKWRRPYVQPFAPHLQTWWLTLCKDCDEHQAQIDQALMKRLGYRLTSKPDTIKTSKQKRWSKPFYTVEDGR